MKTFSCTTVFMMVLLCGDSFSQGDSFTKLDSIAVNKVIQDWKVSWNNHDTRAFAAVFLPDGEFTNVTGHHIKGRKNIEDFHAPMFEGRPGSRSFKSSTISFEAPRISVLKPDVASVDFVWGLDKVLLPDGSEIKNRRGLITWLMVKKNAKWEVAIMHNAELPPLTSNK